MPNFGRGVANAKKANFFEASLLDDGTKLKLCQDLLSEFGAQNVQRPRADGEIVHSCPLPFGAHANGDRRPSASLNYKKLAFRCLGCGARGGLLWFVAVCRGEDDLGAARSWLGEETGLGGTLMERNKLLEVLEAIFKQQAERPEDMPVYPVSALKPWTHDWVHPYLTDHDRVGRIQCRGIPEENCRRFRIGYAEAYPMGWDVDEETGERTPRPPEERIVIPIFWNEQLVGWQARALNPDSPVKYKNSPKCPRDRVLYGWPGPGEDVEVVESPMSVLRHCHHRPVVATFGKVLTEYQLRILRTARSVTLALDPDLGGWQGTEAAIQGLKDYVPLRVVEWVYREKDPADYPDDLLAERLDHAVPWSLWRRPKKLLPWKGVAA